MSDTSSTASHQTVSANQLHLIIDENILYTAPSTQTNVLVAVKDSQNAFLSTSITLVTNSNTALWQDTSAQEITLTTSDQDYVSVPLILTSPGLFYISGKM